MFAEKVGSTPKLLNMRSNNFLKNSNLNTYSKLFSSNFVKDSNFMASFIIKTLRWNKNYLLAFLDNHLIHYPTPTNLTYAWSFGSSAGICLVIQILSGIFLAMHYTPHIDLAFSSVEHIMRDVNNGWFIRYIHANGASMFFIVVYCHIFRGLYYGSYMQPRQLLWCSGVIIFILMMATAFMGYVLPWGQMSFWGATVITSLVTAVPLIGQPIVDWLWGGFTINNATLNRFFSLHFFLPFVIAGLTIIHLALLHKNGSNNPLGIDSGIDKISFYPYFFVKDLFAFFCFLLFFGFFVFYFPNALGHPDNYIPADPMQTPAHIVPEWYFLPFYAILRSIPDKFGGVAAMVGSLLVLFLIPFTNTSEIRSTTFRPIFKIFYWLIVADFLILGWIGQKPVKDVYVFVGQIATIFYFLFFVLLIPIIGIIESKLIHFKLKISMLLTPLEQFQIISLFSIKLYCLDFSITNLILINSIVLIFYSITVLFFSSNINYSGYTAFFFIPNNWQFLLEIIYETISQLLFDNINIEGEKYFPFISVLFIFILFSNLIGLIPYSFTITSHLIITFTLSLSIFIGVNIICIQRYKFQMLSLFIPANTSFGLALLLVPIEFVSYIFKPISLGVRLFANLMAGHTLLKVIVGFSWSMLMLEDLLAFVHIFPLIILILLVGLELGVAIIQAYVFTILTCIYLNDSINLH